MLLGGAVVTERIFNLPGIAQLSLQAAQQHDVPVVQGTLLVTVGVVLIVNMAVNAALTALSPVARRRRRPFPAASPPEPGLDPGAVAGQQAPPAPVLPPAPVPPPASAPGGPAGAEAGSPAASSAAGAA
jgi:peptide/nickel transport system permease protein